MKKCLKLFFLLNFCFLLFACHIDPVISPKLNNRVRIASIPEEVKRYQEVEVYLGDTLLPLYLVKVNSSQAWTPANYQRIDNGVGYFELEGKVQVTVKVPDTLNYASKLRPLSAGIIPIANLEEKTLSFEISSSGEYVLEINGDLMQAIHFFVSDFSDEELATEVIYFGPGLHTKENNELINQNNQIRLESNTTVYLEAGAVVRAKFYANKAENIKIYGPGIIDGSSFERNATLGKVSVPIDFNHCTKVELLEFSILDPAGWAVNFYFMKDCLIDDIKIITSRSNGDGISLQSCEDIIVDGCYVRSWDDSLVVKNYPLWEDRSIHGKTSNILFQNCTLWTDLAQSMELGYETVGEVFSNIIFKNITVLHALHKPVISIHNGNNAKINGVKFENITVEDASMGKGDAHGNDELIDLRVLYSANWTSQHTITSLGSIDDVLIKNVNVIAGKRNSRITIAGCFDSREGYLDNHYVSGVRIVNLTYRGREILAEDENINLGDFVSDIKFSHDGQTQGAVFLFSQDEELLSLYGEKLEISNR
ncbi:MAG: glycosyl hydrolase family 28 protein [Bacilli bacterium]|nr:glycosyl hydrolase family 28 protein [Bacilli bacterium]